MSTYTIPSRAAVHPHACGGYFICRHFPPLQIGSPPRMWGILRWGCSMGRCRPVHPHACGGYSSASVNARRDFGSPPRMWGICALRLALSIYYGSPPRMWGICMCPCCSLPVPRFTPTHVGDMLLGRWLLLWKPVHPHACGGYEHYRTSRQLVFRFTPTHVGDMALSMASIHSRAVHPHACGGYHYRVAGPVQ